MKFRFPFHNVMTYRKTVENLAQREFQEAVAVMNEQMRILQEMQQKIVEARESAYQAQVAGGTPLASLTQVHDFLRGQDLRIARQQAKIQDCEKKVEEFREILRLRSIDYKIIEGLHDRKREQFRIDQNKLEQKRTDENNTMRFRRKDDEAK